MRPTAFSSSARGLLILAGLAGSAQAASETAAFGTDDLCTQDESVQFSCHVARKTVSLCAKGGASRIDELVYRYGTPSRVELEYQATQANGNRFAANVLPASPGASVQQVWFVTRGVKYLMTACVGGECPYDGGLAVFRGERLAMKAVCDSGAAARASFPSATIRFGQDAGSSRSETDLIVVDDINNPIELLYPPPRTPR